MPDDLTVVESKPLPDLSVVSSQALPGEGTYSKLTRGYNPDVEEFAQKHPVIGPVVRFLDAAGGAAISTPEGLYNMLRHPSDTTSGLIDSIKAWRDPAVRQGALSVLPEALGQGVGNAAGGEVLGAASGGATAGAKFGASKLGDALTNYKPQLQAGAELISKPLDIPKKIISKIPDKPTYPGASLPDASEFYANRGAELDAIRAKNAALDRLNARQAAADAKAATAPKATPAESIPGGTNYGQYLEQRRIETEAAMKDQAKAAKEAKNAPKPNPFGDSTSSANPSPSSGPLPSPSSAAVTPQFVSKFTSPEPSPIQAPGSAPPPINKTLVSYPRTTLASMARRGDIQALTELIRNPSGINISEAVPNAKFLMEQGRPTNIYGGPKSVTKFSTEGVPLSEMAPAKAEWAYRVRDVGEEGLKVEGKGRPQATTSLEDADRLQPGRESVSGKPQEKVKFDLSRYKEGVDYVRHHREGQPDWIEMLRTVPESQLRKLKTQ